MKRSMLPILFLMAACSTQPEPHERDRQASAAAKARKAVATPSNASNPETPQPDPTTAALVSPPIPDEKPRADPGAMRSFGDWVVGCDNRLTCSAVALGPEGGDYPTVRVVVIRPGGGASPRIIVASNDTVAAPALIAIDGKQVASGGTSDADGVLFTGAEARRLVEAIIAGAAGRLAAGKQEALLSLSGASAALRYMDERQRIAGTTAALVAKGPDRPTATPPAAPTVTRVRATGTAARPSLAQIAAMRRAADCQIEFLPEEQTAPEAHAIGGGATLILLPCGAGAYNFMSAVFVLDAGGTLRPARFDTSVGFDPEPGAIPQLVNAGFERGILSSFARGRGIGDCGIAQSFVWDGRRLRLIEQREMSECRGSTRLVRTWTAEIRN